MQHKFGIELELDEIKKLEPAAFKEFVKRARSSRRTTQKEAEYPVMAGLYRYSSGEGHRPGSTATAWSPGPASGSAPTSMSKASRASSATKFARCSSSTAGKRRQKAEAAIAEVQTAARQAVWRCRSGPHRPAARRQPTGSSIRSRSGSSESLNYKLTGEEIGELDRETLEQRLLAAVEDRYRPEMRRMERMLLLQIVDTTWKDHLLVMDRLRSSVGLVGYAQVDPKVEYKREGMKLFEQMWNSIGDQSTEPDLPHGAAQRGLRRLDLGRNRRHARRGPGRDRRVRSAASSRPTPPAEGDAKPEPIRNRGERVGRNDPCPCGSGKKYKNCHMRKGGGE